MKEAKRLWSWLAIPCIALAVLTGSILPVLLVRGFYTVQIGPLGICEASGLTRRQAAEAYGDVMDYCMGRRPDFAAGVLSFSAEGAGHFADVRGLFLLVVWVFVAAAGLLLAGTVVCRLRRQRLPRLGGRTPGFWAACGLGGLLYNKVRSKVNSELDLLLDEGDVDAILMGKKTQYPDAAIRLTEQMAQEFINDLFSTLRERMLDLQYCKVVFVGGGAILLKRQIETSGKVGTPFFVPKINANADGYEYLYRIETAGR